MARGRPEHGCDVEGLLVAWEWAAEIRRRLVQAVDDFDTSSDDEFAAQLAAFDCEIRTGNVWGAIEAFSGRDVRFPGRTAAEVCEFRTARERDPTWLPYDCRRREAVGSKLSTNGRRATARAANLALSLVRYRYKTSLVDAGWLFEPDGEYETLYRNFWEHEEEMLSWFFDAIAWNFPKQLPNGRDAKRLPYTLPAPVSPEEFRRTIEMLLDGDDVREAIEASNTRGGERASRGGPEDAAFTLISNLIDVSKNTVRDCYVEWHGQDRTALKKLLRRQASIYGQSGFLGLKERQAELADLHRKVTRTNG